MILSWFSVDIRFDFELFLGCGGDSWVVLSWWLENCLLSSLLSCCDRWEWEDICVKVLFISFPLRLFLPIWGDEICGPDRENFLPGFPLSIFSSLSQTVENTIFHSVFRSMFSILSKITPTKHNVKVWSYFHFDLEYFKILIWPLMFDFIFKKSCCPSLLVVSQLTTKWVLNH